MNDVQLWWRSVRPAARAVALSAALAADASIRVPAGAAKKDWEELPEALQLSLTTLVSRAVYAHAAPELVIHLSYCHNGKLVAKDIGSSTAHVAGIVRTNISKLLRSGVVIFDISVEPKLTP